VWLRCDEAQQVGCLRGISTTDNVIKKLGEGRIGCCGRPDPAIPIEVDDDSGLFIMQLWWNPRWRVEEILDTT